MHLVVLLVFGTALFFADRIRTRFGKSAPIWLFLAVCFLCEIFCFNFETFRSATYPSVSNNYSVTAFGAERDENGNIIFHTSDDYIEITDIDEKVENIYLKINSYYTKVRISATDESNANFYTLGERSLSVNAPQTFYIKTHFAGKQDVIRISFPSVQSIPITLSAMDFNCQRPVFFSALRIMVCFLFFLFAYYIVISPRLWKSVFKPDDPNQKTATIVIAALIALLFFLIPFTNPSYITPSWSHHSQYSELADSILDGKLSLDRTVPSELIEMQNPYDRYKRAEVLTEAGVTPQPWDIAFFDGNFYVYFGVLPVFLFYIPFKLLGAEFPNFMGVVIFSWVLIAGVFMLVGQFVKKYCKNIPYLLYLVSSALILFCGGNIFLLRRPDFYSIPIMGGLAFTIMGIYFWFTSISDNGKLIVSRVTAGSVFMALVLSLRPNLVFFSFAAVLLFWNSVFKDRELLSLNSRLSADKHRALKNTIAFCAPYVIVGVLLMCYNYARFKSPFDFGASYNLTTSDMTRRGFEFDRFGLGIFEYLFRPPRIVPQYPYLAQSTPITDYVGFTSREYMYGGIFTTQTILWVLAASYKIKKQKPFKFVVFLLSVASLICLFDIQAGGVLPRYTSDFAVFFVMAAVMVLLMLYSLHPHLAIKFASVALFSMLIYDVLLIYGSGFSTTGQIQTMIYNSPIHEIIVTF